MTEFDDSSISITYVTPEKIIQVSHQSGVLISSPGEEHLVVYSPGDRAVTIFSENSHLRQLELAHPTGQLCLSIDAVGKRLAYFDPVDEQLNILNLELNEVVTARKGSNYVNIRFDGKGRLWAVQEGIEQFVVRVYNAADWTILAQTEVGDSYFLGGGAELRLTSSDDTMFVEIYSGQSEQLNCICTMREGGLYAENLATMDGEQFVFAAPNSQSIVTLDHRCFEVAFFETPYSQPRMRIAWPYFDEDTCEDERPGYYGCYLDDENFLASSSEGRLFLIGTKAPEIKKEIQVSGYVPVPASVKYPTLTDTCGYASDLVYFGRLGRSVVFFFSGADKSQACIVPISVMLNPH